jgi:hypothetical protein
MTRDETRNFLRCHRGAGEGDRTSRLFFLSERING